MLGGVAVLLVVAGGVYARLPRWKLRRRRLVPLTAVDARVDAAARVHAPAQAPACRPPPHRGRQVRAGIATAAAKNVDPMSRFLLHLVGRRQRRHPDLVARIGRYTH